MKKILIVAAAIMAASIAAKADYLFWQVTDSQYSSAGTGGANSSSLYASYNNAFYYLASTATTSGEYNLSNWNQTFQANDEGVSYYVELATYNSSEKTSTATAHSGPYTYSQLSVASSDLIASMRQTVQSTWSGATYSPGAVPEPTSGLMMLVGMALLGLKRRRA